MDIGISSALPPSKRQLVNTQIQGSPSVAKEAASVATAPVGEVSATAAPIQDPVQGALTRIQNYVQTIRRDLSFSLDDSSGRMVVKVTDSASGEVVRQLPSEEALRLAESLEEVRSLLFEAEA